MPVKVTLPAAFPLRATPAGEIRLPTIGLMPAGDALHLVGLRVEVRADEKSADFAERVARLYPPREFQPPTLLNRLLTYRATGSLPELPPPGSWCELNLYVRYYDAFPHGAAASLPGTARGASPPLREKKVESMVYVPPLTGQNGKGGVLPSGPVLRVIPEELPLEEGKEAVLCLEGEGVSGEPQLRLAGPEEAIPAPLREAIRNALAEPPRALASPPDHPSMFQFPLRLGALSLPLRSACRIPLRVVWGSAQANAWLRVVPPPRSHDGWLAIDWGTCNCQVVLYDCMGTRVVGLPPEQNHRFRHRLQEWLSRRRNCLPGVRDEVWQQFLDKLQRTSAGKGSVLLLEQIDRAEADRLHALAFELQKAAQQEAPEFRRAFSRHWLAIMTDVFRTPPLTSYGIHPLELDPARVKTTDGGETFEPPATFPSEIEVLQAGAALQVDLGPKVPTRRAEALAEGLPIEEILGRFHSSLKRVLYRNSDEPIRVFHEGQFHEVLPRDLIQAVWKRLIQLAEASRAANPIRFADQRPIAHVVATYPAVAPQAARRLLREMIAGIDSPRIKYVRTDADEAVAAQVFYLLLELGSAQELGLEAFKSRCRRERNKWTMNVAVCDLGGGTFDLALIRLELTEENPFLPGEDRGAGGRLYVITPTLRASSGHLHLGGELITLRLFKILKVLLADALIVAEQEGRLQSQALVRLRAEMEDRFLENGRYRPGSLVKDVNRPLLEPDTLCKTALARADRVIPTRWKDIAAECLPRVELFHHLWKLAEEAKIRLGSSTPEQPAAASFAIDGDALAKIFTLLSRSGIEMPEEVPDNLVGPTLTPEHYRHAAEPVLQEAVRLTRRVLESRLPRPAGSSQPEPLDWLILSGQTCKLDLVRELFRNELSQESWFVWNRRRITFEPRYAKVAACAGACYIEKRRLEGFSTRGIKGSLLKGISPIDIRINNLFFNLASDFGPINDDTHNEINALLPHGAELEQLDDTKRGKFRSDGFPFLCQLQIQIGRQDYTRGAVTRWGTYRAEDLLRNAGLSEDEFRDQVGLQLEIDHHQEMELLFCRGGKPEWYLPAGAPRVEAGAKLQMAAPGGAPAGSGSQADPLAPHAGTAAPPLPSVSRQLTDVPQLEWEIAIDVDAEYPGMETILFRPGLMMMRFHEPSENVFAGMISPVKLPDRQTRLTFWARRQEDSDWIKLDTLELPPEQPDFVRHLRFSIDQTGTIRVHRGAVPYWETLEATALRTEPGRVVRRPLLPAGSTVEAALDPFSGVH